MTPFNYLIISSICLTVFYITYLLVFRQSTHFKQMRYFLIFSMLIACVLPFNRFQFGNDYMAKTSASKLTEFIVNPDLQHNISVIQNDELNQPPTNQPNNTVGVASIHWGTLLMYLYFVVAILLLIRIIVQISFAVKLFFNSSKIEDGSCKIINLKNQNAHFTLFRWIFINKEICKSDSYNQILKHEKIHAQQYHTFDILLIELLSAVMWFNPIVWMLRKSLKLVHEFIADEGVLSTGVDKFQYQELLINQVAESSLVGFSSSFNSSTIKKRMQIMNATRGKKSKHYLWLLIPIGIVLSLSISLLNARNSVINTGNAENKPSAVVIDPVHSDSTKIDIMLSCEYKNKKTGKTENVYISPQNRCTFDEGMKRALRNKAYLYTAIYGDVKSENEILMSSPDFIPSNADSEHLTKLLNSKLTTNSLVSDTVIWAKIYTPKDKKMPVVLKIGYNQKRAPKDLANPLLRKILNTLDEYYKSSN